MQKHRGNIFPGFKRKRKGKKAEREALRYTTCACDPHLTWRFLSRKRFFPLLFMTWPLQIHGMKRSDDLTEPFWPQWFILWNLWQEKIKYGAEVKKKTPTHGKQGHQTWSQNLKCPEWSADEEGPGILRVWPWNWWDEALSLGQAFLDILKTELLEKQSRTPLTTASTSLQSLASVKMPQAVFLLKYIVATQFATFIFSQAN